MNFEENLSGAALDRIKSKLVSLGQEIEELERKQKLLEIEITGLQSRMNSTVRKELLQDIRQLQETLIDTEKAALRRKMHARINTVIEKIVIHNFNGVFYAWDAMDLLSPAVTRFIETNKISKNEKLISALHSDKGKHIYDEMERYFIVFFKNGEQRKVHPYLDNSWKVNNRRYREFVAQIAKNKAIDTLNDNPKYKSRVIKKAKSSSTTNDLSDKKTLSKKSSKKNSSS